MRRFFLLSATALTGTLAIGCGEQSSPMAPVDPFAPSLSVERTIEHFAFGGGDDQHVVIFGATAENWATFCATRAENFDAWTVLTVTRPDGSQKVGWQGTGLHVLVWNLPADICTESPDYTGTARLVLADNDLDLSGHGANGSGQTGTGTVTDANGQRYRLLWVNRTTVSVEFTSDEEPFVFDTHMFKIQLTPTGK
jgi:hypothetical protein